jgi:hypothetical protein
MKKFIHPQLSQTFIRYKDGSTQHIYWRYLRAALILETTAQKKRKLEAINDYTVYNKQKKYKNIIPHLNFVFNKK